MSEQIEQGNGKIVFWLITVALLAGAAILIWRFVPALLWATVLSVLLYPWYVKAQTRCKRFKHGNSLAALWVTLFTAGAIIGPFLGLSVVAGVEVYNFASDLVADSEDGQLTISNLAEQADIYVVPWAEKIGVHEFSLQGYLEDNRDEIGPKISGPITAGAKRFIMMIVTLIIAFLTTFFMLRDGHLLLEPATELIPLPKERSIAIFQRMAATIRSVFYSVIAVAFIQGAICGLAYWILGVPSPAAWWAMTTFAAMIPLLGAPVIYVPAAALLILQGNVWQGVVMLIIGFGLVSNLDNFLRPIFISMGSNLHMMAIFFSLLGGVLTMGPIGLMAGPMLLTLTLGMLDVLRERRRLAEGLGPLEEA